MKTEDAIAFSGWWRKSCREIVQLLLLIQPCQHGFHAWCDEIGFEATYQTASMDEAIALARADAEKAVPFGEVGKEK